MGLVTSCTCTQEDKYRFKHYVVAVYPRSREAQIVNKDAVDKLQSYIASNPERIPRVCRKVNKLVRTQLQSKEVERVLLSVTLLRALIEHASVIDGFVPGVLDLCERLVQEDEKRRNEDTVRYCVGAASLVTALCIRLKQEQPSVQYASARRLLANSKQRLLPTFVLMGTDMAASRSSASDEAALERLVSDGAAAVRAARLRCRYAALVVIAHLLHTVPESMTSDVMDLLPCILHCLGFYNRALTHIAQRANNNNSGNGNNRLDSAGLVHGGMNASSAAQRWRDVLDHPPTGIEIVEGTQATTTSSSSRGGESSQQQLSMSMVMQYGIQACTYALYGAAQAVPSSEARAFVKQVLTFSLDQRQMRTSGSLSVMVLAAVTNALEQRSQPCGWLVFEALMDVVMRHCLSITTASSSFAGVTAAASTGNTRPDMPLNQYARTLAMKVHYLDRLPRNEKITLLNMLHSLRVVLAEVNLRGARGEDVMQRLLSLTVWRPTQRDTSTDDDDDEPALDDRNNEGEEEAEALRESREALGEDNVANNDDDGVVALAEDAQRENNTNNGSFVTAIDKEVVCEAVAELWQALLSHRTISTTPLRYAAIRNLLAQLTQCQARTTAMSPAVHDRNITQLLHCMVRVAPFVRLWPEAERTQHDNGSLLLVPTIKPFLYSRDETVWRVMALRVLRGLLVGQPILCNACDMSPSATTTAECNATSSAGATRSSVMVVNATRRRDKSRPLIDASHMTSSANITNNNSSETAAQGASPALYTSEADIQATRRWLLWWCVQTCEAIKQGGREGTQQTQTQRKSHTSGSERSLPALVVVPFCQTPACVREVGELMAALLYAEGTRGLPFVLQLLCLLQQRCIAAAMHHTKLGVKATSAHHHHTVKDAQENDEEDESNSTSSSNSSSSASEAEDEKKEGEVVQACTPLMQAVLHMSLAVLITAGRQLRLRTLTNYAEELLRRRRGRQLARCFLSGLVMSRHSSSLMQPHYAVSTGLTIALGSSNPTVKSTVTSASGGNEESSNGPSAEAQQQQQLLLQDTLTPASQLLSNVTWLPESRITHLPSFTMIAQLLSNSPKENEERENGANTISTAAALSRLDWPSFFTHDALTALLQESETNDALPVSDAGDTAHVVDSKEEHKKEEDVQVDEATQQEASASLAERLGLQRSADWPAIANIHLQLVNNTTLGLTQPTITTKAQTTSTLLTLTSATTSNNKSVDAVLGTSNNTTTAATRIAELLTRHHVTASTNLAESYPLRNAATATTGHQAAMTSSTTQTDQPEVQIPPQQQSPATDANLPTMRSPRTNDLHDTTTATATTVAHHDTNSSTMTTTTDAHETVTLRKLDVSTTRNGTQANTVQGPNVRPDMHRIGGEEMTTSPLH